MAEFFATTAYGLSEALEKELKELGYKVLEKTNSGVFFESNWEGCYRANLQSRIASRIIKPVLDFTAYQPDELYGQILNHDFTKYIRPDQTLKVDADVDESMMRDQRYIALKVKDAIVDQFREKFGVRPDVETRNPDLKVIVRAYKNRFHVSIDTSGESLYMRGYRTQAGLAPLKENLGAGLLHLMEWDKKTPLIDPLCGSGTFLIEAAMMALNIAPGMNRTSFGFQKLLNYDRDVWEKVVDEAVAAEKVDLDFKFYGSDIDKQVIRYAKDNAARAGVDHVIEFKRENVAVVAPEVPKGILIMNPPYGARLGEEDMLKDVYKDIGFTLKNRFKGWDAWILSGNKDLILDMKLKATRRFFVYNGPLECRFLKYSMF